MMLMGKFPHVVGYNLLRSRLDLPADFQGEMNIVFIAFQQWQQSLVDTWIPFAQEFSRVNSSVWYYELPVIQNMNTLSRLFINEGMRAGVSDHTDRERTITLYLDKDGFRKELGIPGEDTIHILLVDGTGNILWHEAGLYSHPKAAALQDIVQSHEVAMSVNIQKITAS